MDYHPNLLFIRYQQGVLDYQAIVDTQRQLLITETFR
jgi:hypothetical protein